MNDQPILHVLVGEWSGTGHGEFPTIQSFEYLETLRFNADGRAFVHYEQRTQRRSDAQDDYLPSHWESGFIRLLPDGVVEMVNVQGSGRLEVLRGALEQTDDGLVLDLKSTAFLNDSRMVEAARTITLEGETLSYTQSMHTSAVPSQVLHVQAMLTRKE